MLPKSRRLTRRDIQILKLRGHIYRLTDFRLQALRSSTTSFPRFAVIISSHLIKRAVVRNRLRRRLLTSLSTQTLPPGDYLLTPHSSMLNLTYAEISSRLNSSLSKISLL